MAHGEIAETECSQINTIEGTVTVCASMRIVVECIRLLTSVLMALFVTVS
jgi:hypothetical protein